MAYHWYKTMTLSVSRSDLRNKKKLREKLSGLVSALEKLDSGYNKDELFLLLLSALRANDENIAEKKKSGRGEKLFVDEETVKNWMRQKVIPNSLSIGIEEPDLLKLMVFSLSMPYKMMAGQTRATMSEKTRRTKQRDFVQIFSDTFIGKIGEIAFRKFSREKFNNDIKLDWGIGTDIESFHSDILNSAKVVSIKSTDTLESIWAEAPPNADYGILIKVALPKDFFMKFLAHVSSLKKLLSFVKDKIEDDFEDYGRFEELLTFIEQAAFEEMVIKSFICGFYQTSPDNLKKNGENLPFLGEVHGDKHLLTINKLRWKREDWRGFFKELLIRENIGA